MKVPGRVRKKKSRVILFSLPVSPPKKKAQDSQEMTSGICFKIMGDGEVGVTGEARLAVNS